MKGQHFVLLSGITAVIALTILFVVLTKFGGFLFGEDPALEVLAEEIDKLIVDEKTYSTKIIVHRVRTDGSLLFKGLNINHYWEKMGKPDDYNSWTVPNTFPHGFNKFLYTDLNDVKNRLDYLSGKNGETFPTFRNIPECMGGCICENSERYENTLKKAICEKTQPAYYYSPNGENTLVDNSVSGSILGPTGALFVPAFFGGVQTLYLEKAVMDGEVFIFVARNGGQDGISEKEKKERRNKICTIDSGDECIIFNSCDACSDGACRKVIHGQPSVEEDLCLLNAGISCIYGMQCLSGSCENNFCVDIDKRIDCTNDPNCGKNKVCDTDKKCKLPENLISHCKDTVSTMTLNGYYCNLHTGKYYKTSDVGACTDDSQCTVEGFYCCKFNINHCQQKQIYNQKTQFDRYETEIDSNGNFEAIYSHQKEICIPEKYSRPRGNPRTLEELSQEKVDQITLFIDGKSIRVQ